MFISSFKPDNQVNSSRRLKKKSALDDLPKVSPILISKAAAIERRRLRHQLKLEGFALVCLINFSWNSRRILSQLANMPLRNGYVYEYTGLHNAIAYIPADYYYTQCHSAAIKLQLLIDYHSSFSEQAAIVIKQALDWHLNKCKEMWMQREGLAALSVD
jgi:hypothetical protein